MADQILPLFRREVIDARRDKWLGEAQLTQPLTIKVLTAACGLLLIFILLFLMFGTYTRRVHAQGLLVPDAGLVTLASPAGGRVTSVNAAEGERVRKGQLLFSIDVDSVSAHGPTHGRIVTQLMLQKSNLERERKVRVSAAVIEKKSLQEQLDNSQAQNNDLKSQIALQEKLTQTFKNRADQLQHAFASGLARGADVQDQNYLYIQASAQLAQFRQMAFQLDAKIATLKSQLAEFDYARTRELAELDRSAAQLEQQIVENESEEAIEIRASQDGTLTSIRVHPGQQISAGAVLLTLLPSGGHLQAELFVDSSAIGFIDVGQSVMLRYTAFPFQRFGLYAGHVSEVTRAPINAGGALGAGSPNEELYRVTIIPDHDKIVAYGLPRKLEAGMRVEAQIALERQSLLRWLLDPLNAFKRSAVLVTRGTQ